MLTTEGIQCGNLILHGEGMLTEVVVTTTIMAAIEYAPDCYHPILVTDRLLAERVDMQQSVVTDTMDSAGVCIARQYTPSGTYLLHYKGVKIQVPFLHNLQNAWMMLFGEPLKLKEIK